MFHEEAFVKVGKVRYTFFEHLILEIDNSDFLYFK